MNYIEEREKLLAKLRELDATNEQPKKVSDIKDFAELKRKAEEKWKHYNNDLVAQRYCAKIKLFNTTTRLL